jgi:predicted ATPase
VETHSEAMLKRIMSHLGSDRMPHLSADKVSLSYVSRSADSSSIEQIRVDNNGRVVDEWPFAARRDGFAPLE